MRIGPLLLVLPVLAACGGGGDDPAGDGPGATPDGATADASALVAERPYDEKVPAGAPSGPLPLVVLLHGYSFTGPLQARYFDFLDAADRHGFLLAYPDGTVDRLGNQFWNATDACCGADSGVDDVAYLSAVIDDMKARHDVDPARVFLVGHSNGGFMSHRMACDRADRIAAIAALAGTTWNDPTRCAPSAPVSVLQIHGDADTTIVYEGGAIFGVAYPGAEATIDTWAGKNGCGGALAPAGADVDLDANVAGAETSPLSRSPCPADGAAELWHMRGSGHIPGVGDAFADAVITWLLAHPKT